MKKQFLFIPLLLTISLYNLSSCTREPYEDCSLSFRIDFINKKTKECYRDIDSLLAIYQTDTLYLYSKPHLGGDVSDKLFRNEVRELCLSLYGSGVDFDKSKNPTFTYTIGKAPNFIDTIEFKYKSSSAEIRINGVLQESRATCNEQIILNIIK